MVRRVRAASVKWLAGIEAVPTQFAGYQQAVAYRFQQTENDPGEPGTWILVRSLMIPPGIPDFFTRHRTLDGGRVVLTGRAWSGHGPVVLVQVGVDGEWLAAAGTAWNLQGMGNNLVQEVSVTVR